MQGRCAGAVPPRCWHQAGWVQSGLNTHRAPPVCSALSMKAPDRGGGPSAEAGWCGTPEQGLEARSHAAHGSVLAWAQGSPAHSRVIDGGLQGVPPPPAWSAGHSERAELCGGLGVTRCREAVQSLMEESQAEGRGLSQVRGQTEVESGHPALELGLPCLL